jgi:type II secretory pathway pseudopilin PulG
MRSLGQFKHNKGFTLIEVIISISIFIIVMVVSATSMLAVVSANRKAHAQKSIMDNISFALETISRGARFGSEYSCAANPVNVTNCVTVPGSQFRFKDQYGTYQLYSLVNGRVAVQRNTVLANLAASTVQYITAPEAVITSLAFHVDGALAGRNGAVPDYQPWAVILVTGYSGATVKTRTDFYLETSISQRKYDI